MKETPQSKDAKQEIECFIFGRVQVVLFRDFARRNARSLGVTGFVENLGDSSVHVVAQGEETALKRFTEILKQGPMFARVDRVDITWRDPSSIFETFDIQY